nr:protein maternal effect lethal 26-like [Parasteatoda tepidariorum]
MPLVVHQSQKEFAHHCMNRHCESCSTNKRAYSIFIPTKWWEGPECLREIDDIFEEPVQRYDEEEISKEGSKSVSLTAIEDTINRKWYYEYLKSYLAGWQGHEVGTCCVGDIVLNVDGDKIKAHKLILKARSPVFHKMFTHEAAENLIVSDPMSEIAMKRLLNFLYSGTTDGDGFEKFLELHYAADKYKVISLRNSCKTKLLDFLQANNVCLLFSLANRRKDEAFKNEVVQLISANLNRDG